MDIADEGPAVCRKAMELAVHAYQKLSGSSRVQTPSSSSSSDLL